MRVLFNASVIIAGVGSPAAGSGAALELAKRGKIVGIVSELIVNEVVSHAGKVKKDEVEMQAIVVETFREVTLAPSKSQVEKQAVHVTDPGDAHILATYMNEKCDLLITLDKKHLLVLQGKLKGVEILTPGQLIGKFYRVEGKRKGE